MALSSMTCVTSSGRENLATLFRLLGVLQAPRELLFFKGSSSEFQASKRTRSKPDRVILALPGGAVKSQNAMRFECIKGLGRVGPFPDASVCRSEEQTSELQSLMRISYAVFCLTKTI